MGGGLGCDDGSTISCTGTILWNNFAPVGIEIAVGQGGSWVASLAISFSDVEGGQAGVFVSPGSLLAWGRGMINANPQFVPGPGPHGGYYLSQTAAGNGSQSPCVDTGGFPMGQQPSTTRLDGVRDEGARDMGYHYPAL